MIDPSKLDTTFVQRGGSCVLASYALVNNYFTSQSIESSFQDYCRHFNLPFTDGRDAEFRYAAHFDAEWRKRSCQGYEVIIDLHNHSDATSFKAGRAIFNVNFYHDSAARLHELEHVLQSEEAVLNISYNCGNDFHSVTAFAIPSAFALRDTNRPGLTSIQSLLELGQLRDSALYQKISDQR